MHQYTCGQAEHSASHLVHHTPSQLGAVSGLVFVLISFSTWMYAVPHMLPAQTYWGPFAPCFVEKQV
jgi:hypothetical protein